MTVIPTVCLSTQAVRRSCLVGTSFQLKSDLARFFLLISSAMHVPFVNRPFESEIHGTVNFTHFCCVLLVTWCYRVLLSCYLRPK